MSPILAALHAAHPERTLELLLTNAPSDPLRRDADLAIRMTQPKQQALLAKSMGSIRLGLYARRDYLARSAPIERAADLARYAVIGIDRDTASLETINGVWPDLPALPPSSALCPSAFERDFTVDEQWMVEG